MKIKFVRPTKICNAQGAVPTMGIQHAKMNLSKTSSMPNEKKKIKQVLKKTKC